MTALFCQRVESRRVGKRVQRQMVSTQGARFLETYAGKAREGCLEFRMAQRFKREVEIGGWMLLPGLVEQMSWGRNDESLEMDYLHNAYRAGSLCGRIKLYPQPNLDESL